MKIYKVELEYKADWSERRPETMEWHRLEVYAMPGKDEELKELLQAEYGGFGKIRKIKVLSEHHLIQYIMTHNQATINRAISELRNYREE